MTSKRRKMAPQCLPYEIMEEILLRLPAYSVVRFHAVCRSWATLLSSPGFKKEYAAKAQATKFVFFAPSAASPRGATAVYSCAHRQATDLLFTIDRLRPDFLVVTSKPCHGLTLLTDTRSLAYWVCNVSTFEFRRLPQRRHHGLSSAGLAYDDRTKEHKVVQLFYHGDYDIFELGCEVYTLCTPSQQWRPTHGGIPRRVLDAVKYAVIFEGSLTKVPPVFANGYLHWQLYPQGCDLAPDLFPSSVQYPYYRVAVLCFSVADETFSLVAGPAAEDIVDKCELDDHSTAVPLHLVDLNGSLCMVRDLRHLRHGESTLEIWTLRDYGASTWSLDYRVVLGPDVARDMHSPRFLTVLGGSAEKILIATSHHRVHAYDLSTGNVETVLSVPVGVEEEAMAGIRIGVYEDSFARVGGESRQQQEAERSLIQILLRLPLKSIGMCALVCKRWRTLIQSDSFVMSHMLENKRRRRRRRRKVMMVTEGKRFRKNFFCFTPLDTLVVGPSDEACYDTLANGKIICSKPCRGLNLISTSSDDYLCNPGTGSIRCVGISGKFPRVGSGRSVGLGFDRLTQEHVVVEISQFDEGGAPVCMVKTSCVEHWSCVGEPPRPVTDMPPAHVDGTLYWMSATPDRVIVAFDVPTRAFSIFPCHLPCSDLGGGDHPFLVELEGVLSLVVANVREDELRVWMMREHGTWSNACNICLDQQPNFSLKIADMIVPLEMDSKSGRILLNTGRALGSYDTRTRTLHTLYSLDQLHLPRCTLAFPMLSEDSLVRIQDDELPDHVAPPLGNVDGTPRYIFRSCENSGCQGPGAVYAGSCCRRVLCRECSFRCVQHTDGYHTDIPSSSPRSVSGIADHYGLPLDHPSVPGPEYCYYYSDRDEEEDNVGRHVFVSLKDLARNKQPRRLVECGYRMDGEVVRDTWVRRYCEENHGFY
ncbi:unnamed protein product [Alopecurus aequalis]